MPTTAVTLEHSPVARSRVTTKPLGGTPAGGGLPITTPGVTGLGNENGTGFAYIPILLRRRK